MGPHCEPAKDMDRRPRYVPPRPLRGSRHPQRLQHPASQACHDAADRRLYRPVDRGFSSVRRGTVLLVRNVLKLYADQRSRVMGTRLRTRMLWGAVLVSLVPIASMFAFSYQLMNRAVDRWFSQPVTDMRDDSNNMALELARYTQRQCTRRSGLHRLWPARATGGCFRGARICATRAPASARSKPGRSIHGRTMHLVAPVAPSASRLNIVRRSTEVLRQHEITLQNGFAIVYREGRVIASFHMPQRAGATAQVKTWLPDQVTDEDAEDASAHAPTDPTDAAILSAAQRNDQPVFSLGSTDYALGATTIKQGNTVVVGLPMPFGMAATMSNLRKHADAYWVLYSERRQIRDLYMLLLLMMTSLALFASMLARASSLEAGDEAG